jgi:hypothetical protein
MAHGLLIEAQIAADNIDALNRHAVSATADFDGGNLVELAPPTAVGHDEWTAKVPTVATGLYIAYPAQQRFIKVGDRKFAGLTVDEREYTNLQGDLFNVFKPKVGDEISVSIDNLDADSQEALASIESGDILEAKAGQKTFTRVAKATGATANTLAFEIEYIHYEEFPKAGIGFEKVPFFRAVCIAE